MFILWETVGLLNHISDVSGVERRVSGKIFLVYIANDCIIPEDLNRKIVRNMGNCVSIDTASHSRGYKSSCLF